MAEEDGRGGASVELPVLYRRECFLMLAIQVVTVTYVAGLNPPGGIWPETKDGHLTGNPILALTNHVRYNAFSCSNTAALVASVAVVLLLLFVRGKISTITWFNALLGTVMSLGMLALAVAYAAGASRQKFTTIYASASVALLFLCFVFFISISVFSTKLDFSFDLDSARAISSAIFVISMAYTAGLCPPGAFWLKTQEGHLAGDPALPVYHRRRFTAFFVGNTMAFVGSLFTVPMVLTSNIDRQFRNCWFYICNGVAGNGLWIAYAAGSCIDKAYIAYVLLSGSVISVGMALIMFVFKLYRRLPVNTAVKKLLTKYTSNWLVGRSPTRGGMNAFVILVFTTTSATVTYQAGLNPPGGVWLDDMDGHKAGDPILLAKQPARYRVFVFCNSVALVASLASNFLALTQSSQRLRSRALDGLLLLDLIGLVGAYAAGCCRDVDTSIHVISLGGAIVVYVVVHMAFLMPRDLFSQIVNMAREKVELDRDLMLGILGAALTYQTGLNPPGGFWQSDDEFGHHAGEPVLLSTYPNRYKVFFYLNALCFMASIFLTVLFVDPLLYMAGIRCRALFVCVLAVPFGLMSGYAAGSYRNLGTSMYIIVLGTAMIIFIISILYLLRLHNTSPLPSNTSIDDQEESDGHDQEQYDGDDQEESMDAYKNQALRYLVLIGSIGATATYQAGFAPPLGFWPDNSNNGRAVGNPALRDVDAHRYRIFFFFNTTSFAASVWMMNGGPIMLLVRYLFYGRMKGRIQTIYTIIQAPTAVYAIGILGAYAAGSSSGWNNTSTYAMALVAPVLFCIFLIDPMFNILGKMANAMMMFEE